MDPDPHPEASYLNLVIYDDELTPYSFVLDLLRSVFNLTNVRASRILTSIEDHGRAVHGPYPRVVAEAMLAAAQQRIAEGGYPLRMVLQPGSEIGRALCRLCGIAAADNLFWIKGKSEILCDDCMLAAAEAVRESTNEKDFHAPSDVLEWHFGALPQDQLVTSTRKFPAHMQADVQRAVDALIAPGAVRFFGVQERSRFDELTVASMRGFSREDFALAPPRYQEIDIGEPEPVKCLQNGLWLRRDDGIAYAVLLSVDRDVRREIDVHIEIVVPLGEAGARLAQRCLEQIERAVEAAQSYRGKVLSFDVETDYRGRARGLLVHRLPHVSRDEVILPDATLRLLDRNVLDFIGRRDGLRRFGLSTRKGILLYGPPGTGKTHTIRYLASNLPGHTTLIITAAQMALLDSYMQLARLLQPAMVVIEDVDLIGRDRTEMGPCEEVLLNRLLNHMDGLKEDADILFVLTTNRPEDLEVALASRPGRIDQAIEVPLPDEAGRRKLAALYGRELPLDNALIEEVGRRTRGVSAAFIKELMRRVAQASIARDGGATARLGDVEQALQDMVFTSGRLNAKLLGGALDVAAS